MPHLANHSEWRKGEGMNKPCMDGKNRLCRAASLLIIGVLILTIGCKGSDTIWSASSRSPDGTWLASARTIAQSGFGTGYIGTKVYLNWSKGSQPNVQILGLSYEYEVPHGITAVEMKWLTPAHLEVSYKGHPTIVFQAIKCGGVDITVRDGSDETPDASGGGMFTDGLAAVPAASVGEFIGAVLGTTQGIF